MIAYVRAYTQLIVRHVIFDHGVYPEIGATCKEATVDSVMNGSFGPSPELGTCQNHRLSIQGSRGQGHAGNPHERLVESSLFSIFNLPHNPGMGPVTHDAV
jgi:hypothetical protein